MYKGPVKYPQRIENIVQLNDIPSLFADKEFQKNNLLLIVYRHTNGNYYKGTHTACHACLSSMYDDGVELYTSKWNGTLTKKKTDPYFDLLLDKSKSPWRCILNDIEVHRDYVHFKNMDISAQVLHNLCIALRMPRERPERIKLFNMFRDAGYDDIQSLYLMGQLTLQGSSVIESTTNGGHFPFNDHERISFQRLKEGKPDFNAGDFMSKGVHLRFPTNEIWKGGNRRIIDRIKNNPIDYEGNFNTYRRYSNWNGKLKANYGSITPVWSKSFSEILDLIQKTDVKTW